MGPRPPGTRRRSADRPHLRANSPRPGQSGGNFSEAAFAHKASATWRNAVSALSGLPGGIEVSPRMPPDRGQVQPMDHGTAKSWEMSFVRG